MATVPHSWVWRHSLRAAPAAWHARQRAWAAPRTPEERFSRPAPSGSTWCCPRHAPCQRRSLGRASSSVTQDEFKKLFDLLDLDITENQKENLFAFCDADCSGDISEKEFGEGWDMMVEVRMWLGCK